jgi:GH24 family phage-related lysozyme (muramidase)
MASAAGPTMKTTSLALILALAPVAAFAVGSPTTTPSGEERVATPAFTSLDGIFAIQNKKTGRCADLPGFGPGRPDTPVNQYTCNFTTADNQRWRFVPRGRTQGSTGTWYNRYQIVNAKDGLCLDAPGYGDNSPGALVSEYTCRGTGDAGTGDNQRWYTVVRTATDGRTGVWIVNRASRLCLDVQGLSADNDARLTLARCSDASAEDHYWRITQNPTVSGSRKLPSELTFSSAGASFIAYYEGFEPTPDEDPTGNCTIGYGHLIHRGACTSVDYEDWGTITRSRGLDLLREDANRFASGIRSSIPTTPLSQSEFDALVSFSYNIGLGGFNNSKVREDLVASPVQYGSVPEHMLNWVSAGGTPLCGLYKRRVNEGEMFARGDYTIGTPACPYPSAASVPGAVAAGPGSAIKISTSPR